MVIQNLPGSVVQYLLSGDPSIRWQTQKYLLEANEEVVHNERLALQFEGWPHQILQLQEANGLWGGTLMYYKYHSTLWVLAILRRLGIYPLDNFILPCQSIIENQLHYTGAIIKEGTKQLHSCLSGIVLAICCYFRYLDPKIETIFHYLVETQTADGGWVCLNHRDPLKHQFLTTLLVLEGLREYQKLFHIYDSFIRNMQYQAHEFLLDHYLFKQSPNSTLEIEGSMDFPFPIYHYDILTVLDYFREMQIQKDPRIYEALTRLSGLSQSHRYRISHLQLGDLPILVEEAPGYSRYNTLRAWRVLQFWNQV